MDNLIDSLMETALDQSHAYERMNIDTLRTNPARFINREISWLEFNRRVLEEAQNPNHPLLERARFLSICGSNMDEFYMVRVAGLKSLVRRNDNEPSIDGMVPLQQLETIRHKAIALTQDMQTTWRELQKTLGKSDITILQRSELSGKDMKWLGKKFEQDILPVLTPIAVDPAHPFPFIPNKGLSIALEMVNHETGKRQPGLIQIPKMLERFVRLPGTHPRYMLIEKIIIAHIEHLFPPPLQLDEYATFRIIRDSELEIEEEAEDLVMRFENALKRRRRGRVIHLNVHHTINPNTLEFLRDSLEITDKQIYAVNGMVGLSDVAQLISDENPDYLFAPFKTRSPERIEEFHGDCFAAIRHKDILVHHPYETFDVVINFLKQAAADPDVVSIKQTLYRTSEQSQIVDTLIKAAEAGKSVTALVEIKARFDEEANLRWGRDMERAGVQVVYGLENLKTHAKVSLVTRREGKRLNSYAHFGTGNYHSMNARIYTDLSFFTCEETLCKDAALLFNYMTSAAKPRNIEKLIVSPLNLRETLVKLIDQEIINARAGLPAQIWAKCNALLDPQIIDKFYQASQAGVQINLVVRGACALRPGIEGLSENIHVESIVGRFLEHARVYCFANGQDLPSRDAKVFIASADIMPRNLNRRVEAMVPIENKTVHKQVLDQIMMANLKDIKQSWRMNPDGTYTRYDYSEEDFCAHDYFMENPSLSGRGKALRELPSPPELELDAVKSPQKKRKK